MARSGARGGARREVVVCKKLPVRLRVEGYDVVTPPGPSLVSGPYRVYLRVNIFICAR